VISNTDVAVLLLVTGAQHQTHEVREEMRRRINKKTESLPVEFQVPLTTSCRKIEAGKKKDKKKKCQGPQGRVQCV
jgi:hypothetical protein